jgi:type IV pilus assembly protein PilE
MMDKQGIREESRIMKRRQAGLTLIELIIVVVIIGILAAIAVPSYSRYVIRSHRSEGKAALLALATAQEKFYLQCNAYADTMGTTHSCADSRLVFGNTTENGWYTLSIVADETDATRFVVRAAAAGNQARDTTCAQFEVNDRGVRTATSAECWD